MSALSSEFCTVQVLEGLKNLSALRNSIVSAFGSILKYCINGTSIGTASSGHVSEGTAIGRCSLREVPLYLVGFFVFDTPMEEVETSSPYPLQ